MINKLKKIGIGALLAIFAFSCAPPVILANEQDRPWEQLVGDNAVPGYKVVRKFGVNSEADTGTVPEDMWTYGGLYTFSTSADIDTISSSDVDDTQEITIQGLDEDWLEVTQTVNLSGQAKVPIPIPMVRCFRMYNSDSTDLEGTVYVYVDSAISLGVPTVPTSVRAEIPLDVHGLSTNQTEMCIYTVPADCIGYIYSGYLGMAKSSNNGAILSARVREFGGVFRVLNRQSLSGTGSTWYAAKRSFPAAIPPKTDILYRIDNVDANDTGTLGGFTILLKKIYP